MYSCIFSHTFYLNYLQLRILFCDTPAKVSQGQILMLAGLLKHMITVNEQN